MIKGQGNRPSGTTEGLRLREDGRAKNRFLNCVLPDTCPSVYRRKGSVTQMPLGNPLPRSPSRRSPRQTNR